MPCFLALTRSDQLRWYSSGSMGKCPCTLCTHPRARKGRQQLEREESGEERKRDLVGG
jgi:hypothetical protein